MYFALKSLHLLAVMIFLGNIITGLFWIGTPLAAVVLMIVRPGITR